MSNNHRCWNCTFGPVIPIIDMHICPANGCPELLYPTKPGPFIGAVTVTDCLSLIHPLHNLRRNNLVASQHHHACTKSIEETSAVSCSQIWYWIATQRLWNLWDTVSTAFARSSLSARNFVISMRTSFGPIAGFGTSVSVSPTARSVLTSASFLQFRVCTFWKALQVK